MSGFYTNTEENLNKMLESHAESHYNALMYRH